MSKAPRILATTLAASLVTLVTLGAAIQMPEPDPANAAAISLGVPAIA